MSEGVRRMLVAYDITDDRRRDRVAVALQHHGERIQFSVFMVDGTPAEFVRLEAQLSRIIDSTTDSVLLCDLGDRRTAASRTTHFLGVARRLTGDDDALIL